MAYGLSSGYQKTYVMANMLGNRLTARKASINRPDLTPKRDNTIYHERSRTLLGSMNDTINSTKNAWKEADKRYKETVEGKDACELITNIIPEARDFTAEEAQLHEESLDQIFEPTGRNIFDL